jgi:integrase
MSAKLVRTATPGIYKKQGAKTRPYIVVYRAAGKQRKEMARTLEEARMLKRSREADRDRGEFQVRSRVRFREFLSEWIDRYQGNGRRGFRENTREEYRRLLDRYAHRYFGERLRLCDVTPHHLAQFVAWLADPSKQGGARLSDSTIRNILTPIRAALATAKREGLIRHNPATGLALPARDRASEEDEEEVRVLSREQLRALLDMAPERYRLLLELIASTGIRISEAIGLQVKHLHLSGSNPHVRVRRGIVRGRVEAPKTRHGRRSVPLSDQLVLKLREHLAGLSDQSAEALVFPSQRGTPLNADNLRARMFKPLAEEVGAGWAGFHTLRHTFASLQISERVNLLQLSRVLGHHSAAFTLSVYAHLLEGDQAPALDLAEALKSESLTVSEVSTSEVAA